MKEGINQIQDSFSSWLLDFGVNINLVQYVKLVLISIILLLLVLILDFITQKIILKIIDRLLEGTKNKWDDVLVEKKVFKNLSHIIPALLVLWITPYLLVDFPRWIPILENVVEIFIIIVIIKIVISFLNAIEFYFKNSDAFKDKPIDSYFQLAKLVTYIIASLFILSAILGRSPLYFLSAFGAISAIILLIFKDTLLGFVASIQIAANDMVKVNDWVEMSKFGADGNVVNISLNTIKVQNWDNTITTIPTYAFVSDSFKNWRGMQETGGRRIKRQIYISLSSIQFCDEVMIQKLKKIQVLQPYIDDRQNKVDSFNQEHQIDKSNKVNGRNLTNIGLFRKYAEIYLNNHNDIRKDMTLMVRQLAPKEYGLPLEIYCFTNTIEWMIYENIQSDIFDHLLSVTKEFGLEMYELRGVK